jgi:hypothetical protein
MTSRNSKQRPLLEKLSKRNGLSSVISRRQTKTAAVALNDALELVNKRLAQKFMVGKLPVFLDVSGNVVEVEQGQAGASKQR